MKSSLYKAGAHLSEVTSEERQLILNSSENEEVMTGVAIKTKEWMSVRLILYRETFYLFRNFAMFTHGSFSWISNL